MQKPKSFRPWQPEQTTLLPPSPREWLSEDHQAYFLLDLVDELDLSEILIPASSRETLENPAILRENGLVSPGVDWLHGRQAVRLALCARLRLR
jgi:hypothetical protein